METQQYVDVTRVRSGLRSIDSTEPERDARGDRAGRSWSDHRLASRLRRWHGLEFVERRGQPFQSTIVSDEVEMQ